MEMARRYMYRCRGLTEHEATDHALDYVRSLGVPFGHEEIMGDPSALADDDLDCWEQDETATN
ncbi:hypothetical protein BYZ73_04045 [Rhodovulum viride]|uniref:Uncharacterized protein n=2 Tax=Rhodovulum viride TaxID=1231134 RepID=A0ABX9DIZ9_9RHOB|nr:hypothetical protein BYZ73_04045 [Rhodovulum viride]